MTTKSKINLAVPNVHSGTGWRWYAALFVLATLGTLLLFGYMLVESHKQAVAKAITDTSNLTRVLERQLDSSLRRMDADLQNVISRLRPEELEFKNAPRYRPQWNRHLNELQINFVEVMGFFIIDANGDALYSTGKFKELNVADRTHFKRLKEDPNAGLVWSDVVNAKSNNRPTIGFARGIRDRNGKFMGMVVALVDMDYFQKLILGLDIGPQGLISIRDTLQYKLLLRQPERPGDLNKASKSTNFDRILKGDRQGFSPFTSPLDGVTRYTNFLVLNDYPFVVTVALGKHDVLAAWHTQALVSSVIASALLVLVSLVLMRLWRAESTRRQTMVDLMAARDSAEEASRSKGQFLANMSHEIRTPMNGILGMLKLLQHTELTARQSDYTRKAGGATQALLGIINDILDFSKVEAGKLELDNQALVIGDLLRELSVILSANLGSKNLEVLFKLASDVPPVVIGDALRLRQILINLAGNALKFTEQGEVVLGIRLLKRDKDRVELEFSIRDTGIGIAADKLGYIFEGFSQAESTTSRRFGGTGLGLAISQRLVALMGGTLAVESEFGKGSRFFFSICVGVGPATAAATSSPQADPAAASSSQALLAPGGAALRVLIVDDNALSREILNEMASAMGWKVESVVSGEAAMAHLEQVNAPHYDLVLMDWRMPGMDGWQTIRKIRQLKHGERAPVVIMVTAASRELLNTKTRLETELVDGYLVKPITASMLSEAVAEAMVERKGEHVRHSAIQASARLAGLRLLVVEDNLLNQQIARELLELCGARITIAGGGLEGVEQAFAADPPFDAILMDVQMPDIHGLEATRRIRAEPRMRAVPIIAMTANAMEADKEACRAVGMVDHVSKPIDLNALINTVLRHAGHHRTGALATVPTLEALPTVAEHADVIAASLIDIDAAVNRMGGNREFFDKFAFSFRTDAALFVAELQGHIRLGDYAQAVRSAHTLKGLAATVGAVALSALVQRIETTAKSALADASSENAATLADMSADLTSQFALVLAALPHSLPPRVVQVGNSAAEVLDVDAFAAALQELATLLKLRDMQATIVGDKLRQKFGSSLDADQLEHLSTLEQALARLDFVRAIDVCDAFLPANSLHVGGIANKGALENEF